MKPRFQFSLRNALWAMFWASVCGASFSVLPWLIRSPYAPWGWPRPLYELLCTALIYLFVASPFVAIGFLFGRPVVGVVVGSVVSLLAGFLIVSIIAEAGGF
jgi:hypothetical protein